MTKEKRGAWTTRAVNRPLVTTKKRKLAPRSSLRRHAITMMRIKDRKWSISWGTRADLPRPNGLLAILCGSLHCLWMGCEIAIYVDCSIIPLGVNDSSRIERNRNGCFLFIWAIRVSTALLGVRCSEEELAGLLLSAYLIPRMIRMELNKWTDIQYLP